jgi:DNA-binding IscR family transcriptional regulator
LRWLWKDVRDAVAEILERTTFADLAAKKHPAVLLEAGLPQEIGGQPAPKRPGKDEG